MKATRIKHGIEWGCSKMTLLFSDDKKGWVTYGLDTPKYSGGHSIQIYVTKSGKVRIHSKDGEWNPPNGRRKPMIENNDEKQIEGGSSEPSGSVARGDFYLGIEWLACWLLDNAEGETIEEDLLRGWAVEAWRGKRQNESAPHNI